MCNQFSNVKLVDCTLRDGGYYNNWFFPDNIAREHVMCAAASEVDYVEIGFRFYNRKQAGSYANISNDHIRNIIGKSEQQICIMVNGSDLIKCVNSGEPINNLLPGTSIDTSVSLLRVAVHFDELTHLKNIFQDLIATGYTLAVNLMQITNCTYSEIEKFIYFCNHLDLEICYFADSLGSLQMEQTQKISRFFRENFNGRHVGFHAHDNNGLAFSNCIAAVEGGVSFLDGSVTGMGRGAGNVLLENLLLKYRPNNTTDHKGYLNLIANFYGDEKSKLSWGNNIYYYYASQLNIHPTYCQNLLELRNLSPIEIMSTLRSISETQNPSKYDALTFRNIEIALK